MLATQSHEHNAGQTILTKLRAPFRYDEIEFRLAQCGESNSGKIWAMCLAYISARAIQDRLDEVCGPENWKVSYEFPGNNGVICNLSIKIGNEWLTKQDGAEFTEIESFKGGISSALKRAGSTWGMGRYLYSLESSFATIVDKDVKGAQYGKTKSGRVFYWIPTQLPSWALPGHPEVPATVQEAKVAPSSTIVSPIGTAKFGKKPSEAQLKRLFAISKTHKIPEAVLREYISKNFQKLSSKELDLNEYDQTCDAIESGALLDQPEEVLSETEIIAYPSEAAEDAAEAKEAEAKKKEWFKKQELNKLASDPRIVK